VEGRPDLTTLRRVYAEELRARAHLRSDGLVAAFATVPRERFLGSGPWQILTAVDLGYVTYRTTPDADPTHLYHNVLVAIDADRLLNNGLPSALAGWLDALDLQSGDTVVHVGCGTGYYTAILAEVVGPHGRVVGIEIDPTLARRARDNLSYLNQVEIVAGDGGALDAGAADAIFVNGGATHPRSIWIDSLRANGRLLLPITASADAAGLGWGGMFMITNRHGSFDARFISEVGIFPCLGARDADLNRQLSSKERRDWRSVGSLRRDPHEPHDSCWLHTQESCLSREPLQAAPSNQA
jgi:protein-L-isoaspartate(D-aspartate) O-methyltransferase